jgi:hypothetical protein
MAVSVTYRADLTVVETIGATPALSSADQTITHNALNRTIPLTASSTPDAELVAETRVTLTAGAATIDLTAIPTNRGGTIDGTGKKVRAFKFRAPSDNTGGAISVAAGASNGLAMAGSDFKYNVGIDCEVQGYLKDTSTAIDATHKTLDLAGTGTDALDVIFVLG